MKTNESDGDVSGQTPVKSKVKKPSSAKKTPTASAKKTTSAKPKANSGKSAGAEELSENDGDSNVKADDAETDADGGMGRIDTSSFLLISAG